MDEKSSQKNSNPEQPPSYATAFSNTGQTQEAYMPYAQPSAPSASPVSSNIVVSPNIHVTAPTPAPAPVTAAQTVVVTQPGYVRNPHLVASNPYRGDYTASTIFSLILAIIGVFACFPFGVFAVILSGKTSQLHNINSEVKYVFAAFL